MKKARVTMEDVARAANVTPQTVSRAFRDTPDISAETRDRILRIAQRLNYVKNSTATSLRVGNSRLIVVIYDVLVNVYFSIMIDYLQTSLRARGYSILMLSVAESRLDRKAYEFAISHSAAGIVSFLEPDGEIGELIGAFSIPVLLLGRRTDEERIGYLRTDDEQGGALAARDLLGMGCVRPLYVSVDLALSCAYDRYLGFRRTYEEAGFGSPEVLPERGLSESLPSLFTRGDPPDALFCFNDMIAFDALYVLERQALPVIPIIGFDAIQQEVHIPRRLTSVGTDKRAMAERAASLIVSLVEDPASSRPTETLGVELFRGASA